MSAIKTLVLRAAGINCDQETAHAFELAGAGAECVHINKLIEHPELLDQVQILVFPGGFSYGDDVAAGKILANQIIHHLSDMIRSFIDKGRLVLGICNGFQVLVKAGILPGAAEMGPNPVTITYNDSAKFEDRWVYLEPASQHCVFLESGRRIYLPIAHGEGKLVASNPDILDKLVTDHHVAYRYVDAEGNIGPFPINPNGSQESIAALTDTTGRVLGMMPHPERFVVHTQHPHWTRLEKKGYGDGLSIFQNAVEYARANL